MMLPLVVSAAGIIFFANKFYNIYKSYRKQKIIIEENLLDS